ncbi:hypothetical protein LEP1GSC048_0397 [Leptospira santarosai serovar Shermani str. 1342KT]|nr:hypothetical protein LEP1GSC048_0397 [Leptospira santarosai serovar Shermani str. 1342KT]
MLPPTLWLSLRLPASIEIDTKKANKTNKAKDLPFTPFIISSYFNILKVENTMTTKRVNEN